MGGFWAWPRTWKSPGVNNRLADWRGAMAVAQQDPRVLASAPFVSAQGLLSAGANVRGVLVRGVLPAQENTVVDVGRQMIAGQLTDLQAGGYGIVLGVELARQLGVCAAARVVGVQAERHRRRRAMLQVFLDNKTTHRVTDQHRLLIQPVDHRFDIIDIVAD